MSRAPIIEISGVSKSFKHVQALNDVSHQMHAGSVSGFVGANGSGKSTFVSVILGVQRPDHGAVRLAGQDITNRPLKHRSRRGISVAFQTPRLFESLTVDENLAFALRMKRCDSSILAGEGQRLLDTFKMTPHRQKLAGSLSGGQRKLVELIRAMIVEPQVLLVDEPEAGVNVSLRGLIAGELKRLAESGCAVGVVSHEIPWLLEIADSINLFRVGEIAWSGPPAEIGRDMTLLRGLVS
jgi:ABC-type branched-chain amino acid transport systems, ATPase component